MSSLSQYYKILGLQLNASLQDIKQAYRILNKQWHPARFVSNPLQQKEAEEKFKQISLAYNILKDYQPGSAEASVTSEVTTKPFNPDSFYQKGTEYAKQEKYQEAIDAFSQAIYLNPNHLEAYQL